MLFRTVSVIVIVVVSLAGLGHESRAQYYPAPGYYPPPLAYPRRPTRPIPPVEGEDDANYGVGPRVLQPGPVDPGQGDPGVAGSPGRAGNFAALPPEVRPERGPAKELPAQFRRALVDYYTKEPVGTIIVDTPNTYLYFLLGSGKALRYGIGVGREGFTWSGSEKVSRMAEWPDWNPPEEMIVRQPYLPRFMAGGDGNPLGARALYLGDTLFRIHGTNQPSTIGTFGSSGCIRLTNEDITDLYKRVKVGTRVVVLSARSEGTAAARPTGSPKAAAASGGSSDSDSPRQKPKSEAVTAKPRKVDESVSQGWSSPDATQNRGTTEKKSYEREEVRPPNIERETSQSSVRNETSTLPDSSRPTTIKQEAGAFEE
jgi:lipoprotein-anchoring transpeptidase ErfK/SrfK